MAKNSFRRGEKKYVYRAAWRRGLAEVLDAVGEFAVRVLTLGRGLRFDPALLDHPQEILVIRLDHLGDVLFLRPCLLALRSHFPRAKITVLTSRGGAELLQGDRYVDHVLTWEAPWFARGGAPADPLSFWQLAGQLRRKRFDISLDPRGDLRHHLLTWLAGVRLRVGYGVTGGGFLLHRQRPLPLARHEVERNLQLAALLGVEPVVERYVPLNLAEEDLHYGQSVWSSPVKRVVFHPAAGDPAKRWPLNRLIEICDALERQGCEVILVGSAQDHFAAQTLANACAHPPRVLAGVTTLPQLIAVIASAHVLVGSDSGPAHMAITQGVPTVMLWSQTNEPEEWGPWGRGVQAVVVRDADNEHAVHHAVAAVKHFLGAGPLRKNS
jgi:ADP-heptose:LPS heptosyltransferase